MTYPVKNRTIALLKHIVLCFGLIILVACNKPQAKQDLKFVFQNPDGASKPWVFWYWMNAAVSKEGITADLEAMKETGIGGAYLMPIQGALDLPLYEPAAVQLTPEWWEMVQHSLNEADRLKLEIAMHASDGFALAGGPWITPELSMQKLVWSDTALIGGQHIELQVPQPEKKEDYYRDIALYAFQSSDGYGVSTFDLVPQVSTSVPGVDAQFLAQKGNTEKFRSANPCWIQYTFEKPFTCRSIVLRTNGNNYQSHRLIIETSNDGKEFTRETRLVPPRHGWQDTDLDYTHVIKPLTAKYYRFVYDVTGSEPGSEDLDAAKWKPSLKITGIEMQGTSRIGHYEGKSGAVWRIAQRTTSHEVTDEECIPLNNIMDISDQMDENGLLTWDAPEGNWTILRMGHTSTGHTNYTGGGGLGLECDKFNKDAVQLQFDQWFGAAVQMAGPELVSRVLKVFHVDSWECGSQNWSPVFREEFETRRGYDPLPYLPVMAGIPVHSADVSERFLHDVRQTISELIIDNFYDVFAESAHKHDCSFSAECVSPTMLSDGMLHYKAVDIPMGEFWLNSPTHDKPNDMLDAISGAHVYGKQIVQAECFTQLRMAWNEHPAMLKTLGDRNYALGFNRFVYHVFAHNAHIDKKPGISLNGVGLFFQRDQTWWKPGKAWVDYAQRCQSLLQLGRPVADIAVFTGEELPRRAILPDRLVSTLPGIFGEARVIDEKQRLLNEGQPLREKPSGVTHSANMADPEAWIDPMRGYAYDSFNRDALIRLASVEDGRIVLPGGASYGLLVLPGSRKMAPESKAMSVEVANRLLELVNEGATIMLSDRPTYDPGLLNNTARDKELNDIIDRLYTGKRVEISDASGNQMISWKVGKGTVLQGPYVLNSFRHIGLEKDLFFTEKDAQDAGDIAWCHRKEDGFDIYFISNQKNEKRELNISLGTSGKLPELFHPLTGEVTHAPHWNAKDGRTNVTLNMEANGSVFIVMQKETTLSEKNEQSIKSDHKELLTWSNPWKVAFDPDFGGPEETVLFEKLTDWSQHSEDAIRYYSGTAAYTNSFDWDSSMIRNQRVWLNIGEVANIAEIELNGVLCGVAWTPPFEVEITDALQSGENTLNIMVSNTWANRIIRDHMLPENERITWTNVPFRLEGKPLLKAGLLGPVSILYEKN